MHRVNKCSFAVNGGMWILKGLKNAFKILLNLSRHNIINHFNYTILNSLCACLGYKKAY